MKNSSWSGKAERISHEYRIGLLSLACQLKALAEGMPGDHIHYDESNSLEKGSLELIIERVK